MVSVSGYMECVKLHHIWEPEPHAVVYHLYTTVWRFDLYLKCGIYIYIYMYHFHISDQRVKPVHISYIALVLEC